jgi:hypothetical protein
VFWFARQEGKLPEDLQLAKVFLQAGDLLNNDFRKWWRTTGANLFVESKRPLKLRRVNETETQELYPAGKSMLVEVPLNVTTRTLVRQFRELLAKTHGDQRVDVLAHSTAQWKLFTKRYNQQALENQYWVLIYRLLYPNIAAWRIGDRLQLSPGVKLRNINTQRWTDKNNPVTRMQSVVGRYIYKAQRAVANGEIGSFPNFNPVERPEMPFGNKANLFYLVMTECKGETYSPWQQWLHEQFHDELVSRIRRKNGIYGINNDETKKMRFDNFVAGVSDLMP